MAVLKQRLHKKNSGGTYDTVHLETSASLVLMSDGTDVETAINGKAASSHGTHVSFSTTAPAMNGTAAVGTATTVSRSDHVHPVDTSRAAASHTHSGYAASSHNQAASTITAGTFAGQVVANSSSQTYSTYCLRNTRLASADTNPTVNGQICWTYG